MARPNLEEKMLVYRIEHPSDGSGPYRGLAGGMSLITDHFDYDRFDAIVKGNGRSKTCAVAPGHEYDRAMAARDHVKLDNLNRFFNLGPVTISKGAPTDLIYGCTSPDQFAGWFPPEAREICRRYGFQEAIRSVPDERVMEWYTQVCFRRQDAALVERRGLEV